MFETHDLIDLGKGTLVPLQKPGKPVGPLTSLRPIILLSAFRKTLSLLTLHRISTKVEQYLSATHSGFRRGRSTADIVWSHRWFCATCQRYQQQFVILGIDMSKAFDCIRRDRLLSVLSSFLNEDEVRLVRVLLAETSFQVKFGNAMSGSAETTIGTPQGDSLSPVLFVVYLEAALRDIRNTPLAQSRPAADSGLPFELVYADDTDFISTEQSWLGDLEHTTSRVLGDWALKVNPDKTEITVLTRNIDRVAEQWRTCRKLGSLLGDVEDVSRRKQLATVAYQSMYTLWKQRTVISEKLRLRLYEAFVMPVLMYNSGTWGLPATAEASLDAFHRRQLRSLIGIKWPQTINNKALYKRCNVEPASISIRRARWRLFGHVLRLPSESPAILAMVQYFKCGKTMWRGRPRTTLPIRLSQDLERAHCGRLQSKMAWELMRSGEIVRNGTSYRSEWTELLCGLSASRSGCRGDVCM